VLAWVPFAYSIRVPVLFQMAQHNPVTIIEPGTLVDTLPEGTRVTKGQTIAHLASAKLELELVARQGELSRQSSKLFTLQSKRAEDPSVANQITAAQESIRGLSAEIDRLNAAKDQLTIRAPNDGVILAPLHRPGVASDWELPENTRWTGTPLESGNLGCFLAPGESLCDLGNPHTWQAFAFLSQTQAELLQATSSVTVKSIVAVDLTWVGAVSHVSTKSLPKLPHEIVQSGLIPMTANTAQPESPEPIYVATLDIETTSADWMNADSCLPLHNSLGFATIKVAPQSLAYRLWQFLDTTFAVELVME
jgi:putative peptide zinc metalloprotease protein